MRKEYNIKWTDSQVKKLKSSVRKYNNAIRKEAKLHPANAEFLPSEVSYKELKASIPTARYLTHKVNSLNRVTRPKALEVVEQVDKSITTKYVRNEASILQRTENRKKTLKARAMGIEPNQKGKMGTMTANNLIHTKIDTKQVSKMTLERFIHSVEARMMQSDVKRLQEYYFNYMTALDNVFRGVDGDTMFEDAMLRVTERIYEIMDESPDKLMEFFNRIGEDKTGSLDFIYDPIERAYKMERIEEFWAEF